MSRLAACHAYLKLLVRSCLGHQNALGEAYALENSTASSWVSALTIELWWKADWTARNLGSSDSCFSSSASTASEDKPGRATSMTCIKQLLLRRQRLVVSHQQIFVNSLDLISCLAQIMKSKKMLRICYKLLTGTKLAIYQSVSRDCRKEDLAGQDACVADMCHHRSTKERISNCPGELNMKSTLAVRQSCSLSPFSSPNLSFWIDYINLYLNEHKRPEGHRQLCCDNSKGAFSQSPETIDSVRWALV